NRNAAMLFVSRPGSFGAGYCLKYCEATRLGPTRRGSSAATSEGVIPNQPAGTVCVALKPLTLPPGQAAAESHRYMITPSRDEFEGAARVTGVWLCSRRFWRLAKKKSRLVRIGPPNAAPTMSLSSFGASFGCPEPSWESLRKYSFVDVAVRRKVQYAAPLYWF